MTIELVKEAIALYESLNDLMWQYSMNKDTKNYFRVERISEKALTRWERRHRKAKWEESQTSNLS